MEFDILNSENLELEIIGFTTHDIRFPTSKNLDGSDATNHDPDYSAAYLTLHTSNSRLTGNSLVFTIGRGNDIQREAIERLAKKVIGLTLKEAFCENREIYKNLGSDSQLRWLGPDYGIFHMARGAVVNAIWDLLSKSEQKPLWKYLTELSPNTLASLIDYRYIEEVLNPEEALQILVEGSKHRAKNEMAVLKFGLPAYTTSPGWLGYEDEKMVRLTRKAVADGFSMIKYKCGRSLEEDKRRLALIRKEFGSSLTISVDANQSWDVDTAIHWINELREFDLYWVEEPTHPEDIVGHARIAANVSPIRIATGEMAASKLTFKQLLQLQGQAVVQIDATRVSGVNEILAIILMAKKFGKPVCPHAGGVGLCEMVQHFAFFDAVAVSGIHTSRYIEFVDHLHQHFVNPVEIIDGNYRAPKNPGFSAMMLANSITQYSYEERME